MLPKPLHPQCVEKPAATEQWKSGCSPTGTAHCAKERPEPGDEDKSRSHIRKLNYPLVEKGALSLLYTGFKNSLTLLCTCRDTVFGVTYGCVSASLVLSVSLQDSTPFAISQKQELRSLGRLGAQASGSKGVACDSQGNSRMG